MPGVTQEIWENIGQILKTQYSPKYITPEKFDYDNPLRQLVSGSEHFFGTKTLNLFVISRPYGWTKSGDTWSESWPPSGFNDAKAQHIATYSKYTKYQTKIWMDFHVVTKVMTESPSSQFEDMMEQTETRIITLCNELADYGFEYIGRIDYQPDENFFKPYIDAFYN